MLKADIIFPKIFFETIFFQFVTALSLGLNLQKKTNPDYGTNKRKIHLFEFALSFQQFCSVRSLYTHVRPFVYTIFICVWTSSCVFNTLGTKAISNHNTFCSCQFDFRNMNAVLTNLSCSQAN